MKHPVRGLGLGPGDPELMTRKAARLIGEADVIAYPAPDTGDSFARRIAADCIPEGAREIPIVIPMRSARFPAQAVYDAAAEKILGAVDAGARVVVLCEGDPFFYGSFMYLFSRLTAAGAEVEVVPGVTSMTACAAAAARPLCARNEVLRVLPAPMEQDALEAELARGGAFALMKVGRHLPRLREALTRAGLAERAVYLSHASLPDAQVLPLKDAPEAAPYFSMILVPGEDPYATS